MIPIIAEMVEVWLQLGRIRVDRCSHGTVARTRVCKRQRNPGSYKPAIRSGTSSNRDLSW